MTTTPPSEAPAGPAAAAAFFSRKLARLWAGVLLPPIAWVCDLLTRYTVIRYASRHDRVWPLFLSTSAALALLALGARLCWQARREAGNGKATDCVRDEDRDPATAHAAMATLSTWGLALALFFFLLIAAQAYPAFVLDVTEIT